jgi:glycosyltransferase involved in cell wall biosynthesis
MSRATRLWPRTPAVHMARLGGYYDLKHYRRCDHLIGNTRGIVEWLRREGWPADRTHFVPNFVDVAPAAKLPRTEFDTPEDAPLVVALGRLHPNKGFDVLIEAMARLPRAYLWLAGAGTLETELRAQVARLGLAERVRFLGWREDTGSLYATADLVACASRIEPLGNVVLEAWARGVPIVAAAGAGPIELIRDGETGLLVPIEDADALAHGLGRVIEDRALAAALAGAGREAYEATFSQPRVVAAYCDLFERVRR